MPTIETTLSVNYQASEWGVKQAVREIISNAIDGETRGKPYGTGQMSLEYSKRKKVLTVSNASTRVPTKALLMGTSDSRENTDCIGTFGEGLPMALLVMARKGLPVTIINGDEKWSPQIVHSEKFDAEVLAIHTRQMITDRQSFIVEMGDIEPDEAEAIQAMFLRLDPEFREEDALKGYYDAERVLVHPRFRGKIYNKGVFVAERQDLLFGYDVNEKLNRDRSIIDEYDLKYSITKALNAAVSAHPESFAKVVIHRLLDNPNSLENQAQYSALRYNAAFRDAVLAEWESVHGPKTVAVLTAEEARQAELLGLRGIVTPPLLAAIIGDAIGTFASMKEVLANEVVATVAASDLTRTEERNRQVLLAAFRGAMTTESMTLSVVRFGLPSTSIAYRNGEICISQMLLASPVEAIKAVSLEIAKVRAQRTGGRATEEQLDMFANMVLNTLAGE